MCADVTAASRAFTPLFCSAFFCMARRYARYSGVSSSHSVAWIGSASDFRNLPSFHLLMQVSIAVYCVAFDFVDTVKMKPSSGSRL